MEPNYFTCDILIPCAYYGKCLEAILITALNLVILTNPASLFKLLLVLSIFVSSIIFLITAWRVRKIIQKRRRGMTLEEIQYFEDGDKKPTSALSAPYDKEFELPPDSLQIDDQVLGQGAFGVVFRGVVRRYYEEERMKIVAVKTLKQSADVVYLKALLGELKIMTKLGEHENVIQLFGACTGDLKNGNAHIVVEYCENGALDKYLKNKRSLLRSLAKDGILTEFTDNNEIVTYSNVDKDSILTTDQLLKWSIEIAMGMEYLASKQVIHCDLATRNVLLDTQLVSKVSDFGLSKQLYEDTKYVRKNKVPLPWRWMAIEALEDNTFSTKSDVWSFGITLWEIFSMAQYPYPGVNSEQLLAQLIKGNRPPCPKYGWDELYNSMLNCWNADPEKRPTFLQLTQELRELRKNVDPNQEVEGAENQYAIL